MACGRSGRLRLANVIVSSVRRLGNFAGRSLTTGQMALEFEPPGEAPWIALEVGWGRRKGFG